MPAGSLNRWSGALRDWSLNLTVLLDGELSSLDLAQLAIWFLWQELTSAAQNASGSCDCSV
jgi:hypothetical protein